MWLELVQHRPIAQAMEEIAWAAGFFEAEGWAGAVPRPHGRYLIQLSISQYSSTGCPHALTRFRRSRAPGRRGIHATVTQSSVSGIPEVLIRFHETIGGLGECRRLRDQAAKARDLASASG